MSSTRLFKSAKLTWRFFCPRYYALFSNTRQNPQMFVHSGQENYKSSHLNVVLKPVKHISNCSLRNTSDSDSSNEKSEDEEKIRKVLEDKELQNILKDFANDFSVDNEANELLKGIRKNIDGSSEKDNVTTHSCTSDDVSSAVQSGELQLKYKDFSDADCSVIPSSEENYEMFEENEPMYHITHEEKPKTPYIDLKRGITGVFDLHELVQVLRNENMFDVASISIPEELHYADYLVIATAKSERHSEAVAELVNKLYKKKKDKKDPFLLIEGENSPDWKAIDMGNIVLHIFLEETRLLYDIESLWLLDLKFDSGGNAPPDPMLNTIEEQVSFFNSLQQQQSHSPDLTKDNS